MITYYNLRTGREVVRNAPDEWLDASDGWERLWKPPSVAQGDNEPTLVGDEKESI